MFQEGRVIVAADATTLDNVYSSYHGYEEISCFYFEIKMLKREGMGTCQNHLPPFVVL